MSGKPKKIVGKRLFSFTMVLFAFVLGIGINTIISNKVSAAEPAESQLQMQTAGKPVAGGAFLALSQAFEEVSNRIGPSVVNINTESPPEQESTGNNIFPFVPGPLQLPEQQEIRRSLGSGVIVDPKGYIITNNHVIEGATKIKVSLPGGEEYTAKLIGTDPISDIAVIKITRAKEFPYAKIGNSKNMKVGDWVLAMGSPFGLSKTVTAGIISATGRTFESGEGPGDYSYFNDYLQTDASINRGNSGGPLVNMNAEVVGINSFISTPTGTSAGVGFAVPSHIFVEIYNQLLQTGKVARGYVGVQMNEYPFTPEMAKFFGVKEGSGVLITKVTNEEGEQSADGPAAKAGVKPEDVVIEFDGKQVKNRQDFLFAVASSAPGKQTKIKVVRQGQEKEFSITTAERKFKELDNKKSKYSFDEKDENAKPEIGLTIDDVPAKTLKQLGVAGGAYVKTVKPGSLADDAGFDGDISGLGGQREGNIIVSVNGKPINSAQELSQYVKSLKSGDAMVFKFFRREGAAQSFDPAYTSIIKP